MAKESVFRLTVSRQYCFPSTVDLESFTHIAMAYTNRTWCGDQQRKSFYYLIISQLIFTCSSTNEYICFWRRKIKRLARLISKDTFFTRESFPVSLHGCCQYHYTTLPPSSAVTMFSCTIYVLYICGRFFRCHVERLSKYYWQYIQCKLEKTCRKHDTEIKERAAADH